MKFMNSMPIFKPGTYDFRGMKTHQPILLYINFKTGRTVNGKQDKLYPELFSQKLKDGKH